MKADLNEYGDSFGVELVPETATEILRAARLGLLSKKGARVYITFGEANARISLSFSKNKSKYPSLQL